jgi:uncharacterized iron-regulated membrane protein
LLLTAVTGFVLSFGRSLDQTMNPQLFRTSAVHALSNQNARDVLAHLEKLLYDRWPKNTDFTIRWPDDPARSVFVFVRGDYNGTLYFDQHLQRIVGIRGEFDHWLGWVMEIHSELLLGEVGRIVLVVSAAVCVSSILIGFYLWWPSRGHAFRIRRSHSFAVAYDVHRVLGLIFGVAVAITVSTGAYMAWRPISNFVSSLSGESATQIKVRPELQKLRAPLSQLLDHADKALPEGTLTYIQMPSDLKKPIRIRKRLAEEVHPNGLSSVWLHPQTAEVIAVKRWYELDRGSRWYQWIYPLHSGYWWGTPHQVVQAVVALALFSFVATGLWMWIARRIRVTRFSRDSALD